MARRCDPEVEMQEGADSRKLAYPAQQDESTHALDPLNHRQFMGQGRRFPKDFERSMEDTTRSERYR